jgi:signal transduction histidine kinase
MMAGLDAAERLLWLAGASFSALAIAAGTVWMRRHIVGPVERMARDVGAPVGQGEELAALAAAIGRLQAGARRSELERASHLDAVRVALDRAEAQLVTAQRFGLTGRLALGAAHEIGGPMSIAIAAVDAARSGAPPAEMIEAIDDALTRVDAILRELASFGRPAEVLAEPIDLRDLVDASLALARLHPKVRAVSVEQRKEVGPSPVVDAVRRHLEQVVLNLVVNAADASRRSGTVEVGVRFSGQRALLLVDDDGPGVPDHLKDRIFEPFFTSKGPDEGTGLGLAISRRLLAADGATLEVERSPLGGARFVVTFPVAREPDRALRERAELGG